MTLADSVPPSPVSLPAHNANASPARSTESRHLSHSRTGTDQSVSPAAPLVVGHLYRVRWVNSTRSADWTYVPLSLTRPLHDSVGWLAACDAQALWLQPHRAVDEEGDTQHFGDLVIPLCAVVSVDEIALECAT